MSDFDKETAALRAAILAAGPVPMKTAIETDSQTVWVNSDYCLGRFCRYGFDVFRNPDDDDHGQLAGEISRDGMTIEHWRQWQAAMLHHYNITIPDHYRPDWLPAA